MSQTSRDRISDEQMGVTAREMTLNLLHCLADFLDALSWQSEIKMEMPFSAAKFRFIIMLYTKSSGV